MVVLSFFMALAVRGLHLASSWPLRFWFWRCSGSTGPLDGPGCERVTLGFFMALAVTGLRLASSWPWRWAGSTWLLHGPGGGRVTYAWLFHGLGGERVALGFFMALAVRGLRLASSWSWL